MIRPPVDHLHAIVAALESAVSWLLSARDRVREPRARHRRAERRSADAVGSRLAERLEQPPRDAGPAPAGDGGGARSRPDQLAIGRSEREELGEPGVQVGGVTGGESRKVPELRRVLQLEPGCDLGETGVARDERRAAGGRGLGRHHPERRSAVA